MNCRHCGQKRSNRPKGLCWTCYYTPGVRDSYDPIGPKGKRYVMDAEDFKGEAPLPPNPTSAPIGSPEKVRVLSERAMSKYALFHPQDKKGM